MMKRKMFIVLTAMIMAFMGLSAEAASWRIHSDTNRHAHFISINAAMSSSDVQDGDTLYLDPGCNITANQTVSKRVTIIGTGYSLVTDAHNVAAINGNLYLKAAGTKMEGVAVTSSNERIWYVQAENITIERCQTHRIYVEAQHATIRRCRGLCYLGRGKDDMTSAYCTIENCMLGTGTTTAVNIYGLCLATIRNNYLWTECNRDNYDGLLNNLDRCTIVNNIIIGVQKPDLLFTPANLSDCIVTNNVMSCAEGTYPGYPDNICLGSNMVADVFAVRLVDYTLSDREFEAVKDIEQAKGAANDGGDCGPFGGLYPYVFSGQPFGMPYFVSGTSGTRATDGKVTFSNQVSIQKQ